MSVPDAAPPSPGSAPASAKTPASPNSEPPTRPVVYWQRRARIGLALTLFGFLIFLIGARPGLFTIDRSPIIGFVQIAVFLVGLAVICIGGYVSMTSLWGDRPTSIAADIGLRLVATGYVIAVFAGMADIFGFGSQALPKLPFFGPWQARGVEAGMFIIGLGFLLLIPYNPGEKRGTRLGQDRDPNNST
ncbi:MAG: hypothetical protein EHM21_12825 [Chloroflexi bacterium]|nr:MAG: hypothetical protein EHM21_12825 [Chloroflexota bacterium]